MLNNWKIYQHDGAVLTDERLVENL